jgi:hypothetical protein
MTAKSDRYCLDWTAGPTAQIELFGPTQDPTDERYHVRFTPPFRATLRQPQEPRMLAGRDLAQIGRGLDASVGGSADRSSDPAAAPLATLDVGSLERVGGQLYQCVVPRHVQAELRTPGLYLEIGVDERLVELPWELMYDGEFLCGRHYIGRYVNVSRRPMAPQAPEPRQAGSDLGELSVLLISVPQPQPRDGVKYDKLTFAEAEAEAIAEAFRDIPGVRLDVLMGRKASFDAVYDALHEGEYHIVHYSGHAHFDPEDPTASALVLYDLDMATGPLAAFFGASPPVLCFMNACETGSAPAWSSQYDIYGLAWAFLDTGSYLLGSRWKVDDAVAKRFALEFYRSLLAGGKALGPAVKDARQACRADAVGAAGVSWASYVFYGDPRVGFRRRGRRFRPAKGPPVPPRQGPTRGAAQS